MKYVGYGIGAVAIVFGLAAILYVAGSLEIIFSGDGQVGVSSRGAALRRDVDTGLLAVIALATGWAATRR